MSPDQVTLWLFAEILSPDKVNITHLGNCHSFGDTVKPLYNGQLLPVDTFQERIDFI